MISPIWTIRIDDDWHDPIIPVTLNRYLETGRSSLSNAVLFAHVAQDAEVASVAEAIRAWEPRLDLAAYRDEPVLYEPDGTLYGIGLSDTSTLSVRHKGRVFRRGDAIVVPQSVAIEAEPEVSLLAIRHEGRPPFHFRERFIQTWGMDHHPAPQADTQGAPVDILPTSAARSRLIYHCVDLGEGSYRDSSGLNLHLLLILNGSGQLAIGDRPPTELARDQLLLVPVGISYRIDGRVRVGRLIIESEIVHEERLARELALSPASGSSEYRIPT